MNTKLTAASITLVILIIAQFVPNIAWAITWSPDNPLVTHFPYWETFPSVTQAQDEKILVVYSCDREDPSCEIYYVTYDGSAWSSEQRLTYNYSVDDCPSIFRAQNGTIWLLWHSDREENFNIYYKTSSDNGASWSTDKLLTTNMADDETPAISQAANGTIWVVWSSVRTGSYEIWYKTYNGTKWSSETKLTQVAHGADSNLRPTVYQMWDGKIWVVWHSVRNLDINIYYMTYNGVSWSSETPLVTSPYQDSTPSITQARDGTIWLVWGSSRSGTQLDVYSKTSTDYGSSWSAETQLTTSSDDDETPAIINTSDGKLWLVWAKYNLSWDIYYKTSDPIPVHDVAITDVASAPSKVYQGEIIEINVTAENQGTQTETFTVTAYANTTTIESQIITLNAATSTTLTFNWNTTGVTRGNYTISASASTVPNEYLPHQNDNTRTDGTVRVKLFADVNDDGIVAVLDLAAVGKAYGTHPGEPLWNPEADIDRDGVISVLDLATVGKNYGSQG